MKKFINAVSATVVATFLLLFVVGCAGPAQKKSSLVPKEAGKIGLAESSTNKTPEVAPTKKPAEAKAAPQTPEVVAGKLKIGMDFAEIESELPAPRNVFLTTQGERRYYFTWGGSEVSTSNGPGVGQFALGMVPFAGVFSAKKQIRDAEARRASFRTLTVVVKDGKVIDFQFSPPLQASAPPSGPPTIAGVR